MTNERFDNNRFKKEREESPNLDDLEGTPTDDEPYVEDLPADLEVESIIFVESDDPYDDEYGETWVYDPALD